MLLVLALACGGSATDAPDDGDAGADSAADSGADSGAPCGDDVDLTAGRVRTGAGVVEGLATDAGWAFLGVPFATAPTGDLRFRAPEPPGCRADVYAADAFPAACPQRDVDGALIGDEDCLGLNVWTPVDPGGGDALPVLFFVHGGGNVQGATGTLAGDVTLYDGATLAARTHSVVVTTQYRLGALGFLAHPALTEEAGGSGNYGLMDQLAALRWVRDEIGGFGGDPARVLLFGESAGALDTCALLAAPDSAGLYAAALMESGGCTATALRAAERSGEDKVAGTACADAEDVAACLRGLPADELAALSDDVISDAGVPGQGGFGTTVDGVVLHDVPLTVLADGDAVDVPLVVGTNEDETAQWVGSLTDAEYDALMRATFGTYADRALALYPVDAYANGRWAWIAVTTEGTFTCPARAIARAAAGANTSPVYRYWFTKAPEGASGAAYGAFHGLELSYVFQQLDAIVDTTGYRASAADYAVEAAVGGAWAALAATGEPQSDALGLPWPAYDPATDPYLDLGDPIDVGAGIAPERCDFWDELYALAAH